ncbi:tyrosine-type recombinase/integrase [Ralstonia solanacearum]|uniref:DUF4102 domain-containing protein n=2 Tax=Ralstonia solanacearum TaxID=305 RepID=A0A5H2PXQ5_RALSL|nr:integrase arm-type DNA-binding domain-containing protein [Ralstonia solanacearum]AEG68582.1 Phage integrase [Ralstonia solanacearum Po82]AMP69839.1 integrase [Ralstonia solanacearum]AYB60223.1 DUF4102 domain-containing protein [Ralstonia solanacearum]MBB6587031.1 tyrosine-type recombinase/integrase [Ralstonia solanacearum]MCG3577602.1 tyrosine-type recombinase/integrase [Ralstonia solanacearum]
MPRIAKELGALAVSRLSAPGMHPVGKVAGLNLQISRTGTRSWILRVVVGDRRREIGLGPYPAVGLKEAHTKAQAERDKIRDGIDPVLARREAESRLKASQALEMTFAAAAERFIAAKSPEWKNAKHAAQWTTTIHQHANPIIGSVNVRHIGRDHVMQVLEPIWRTKTETASRLRGRIESVLDWARVRGYRAGENPAAWRGNLDQLLPAPNKTKTVRNHPALPIEQMHGFMTTLRKLDTVGARCLEFAILCAARSGEARGALWIEIDLNKGVWAIPGARMKAGKEHRVPLSDAAVALLRKMPRIDGCELVFPSPRGRELSDMTLLAIMRRLALTATPHGFRSVFRDWAGEHTNFPRELAEVALAHVRSDKTEAAYWRKDLLERRRRMMECWSEAIAKPMPQGSVIPMHAAVEVAA